MRELLVIGIGRRVREATLPALHRLQDRFRVRALAARSAREEVVEGVTYSVQALAELEDSDFKGLDLVYLAVGKDSVPAVLSTLAARASAGTELLIDTPVVRFKHFAATRHFRAFSKVTVAEDCAYLPWIELFRRARRDLGLGERARLEFHRSAYAYHGVASAKAVFEVDSVRRARRRRLSAGLSERTLDLAAGAHARIVEPRDYSAGRVVLVGDHGSVGELAGEGDSDSTAHHALEPVLDGDVCRALRAGRLEAPLDTDEADLTRGDPTDAGVTARMEAMKRVGLLRLLRDVADGHGGYPLEQALEDMVVDYWLERLGRYTATTLSSPRSGLARGLYSLLTRPLG